MSETVADLLLARADDTETALLFEDQRITWVQHVRESQRRAAHIKGMLDADSPPHVGVLLDNVPEFSYLLGAAALGGFVVVGLNSTRSGPALVDDVRRTHCQLVLTDSEHRHLVPDSIDIAEIDWGMATYACTEPAPEDLFMLVFTSGTGGEPKAVKCPHSKVVVPGRMLADRFELGPNDTVYVSMPMFHSNAIMAGWAVALASGSNLALRKTFSASNFLPDVRKFGATYANYVGTPLSYVLATPEHPDDHDNPLRIAYGNEATPGACDAFAKRFAVHVVDGFGSSEGGVAIARTPDTPSGALGPLPTGVKILNSDGKICPAATFDSAGTLTNEREAVGELVNTAGPGMFCGYYDNEQADVERMRDGMYWSGDLAYRDAQDYAYFAGRSTGWMRVGGENLAAAPIERILLRHPEIREVSVYGVPASGPGERIMAAIVAPEGVLEHLAEFLDDRHDLSKRSRPELIRLCIDLPRTASHKVLARQLQRERWNTSDPVWFSPEPSGPFTLLTPQDRRRFEKSIGSTLAP